MKNLKTKIPALFKPLCCMLLIICTSALLAQQPAFSNKNRLTYKKPLGTGSLEAVDMDGDNDLDLLAIDHSANDLLLYRNNGGQFSQPEVIMSSVAHHFSTLDFDGDGDMDVISTFVGDTYVCFNDGTGDLDGCSFLFNAQLIFGVDITLSGDFDNDGDHDIVVCRKNAPIAEYWENSSGTFSNNNIVFSTGATVARDLNLIDYNQDGNLDIAQSDNSIYLYPGLGDGSFGTPEIISATNAEDVVMEDINLDGHLDIVFSTNELSYNHTLKVAYNNGDNTYASPVNIFVGDDIVGYLGFQFNDLNSDGLSDIVITLADSLFILTATPSGFLPIVASPLGLLGSGRAVAGDFDLDGDNDVIVPIYPGTITNFSAALQSFENDGTGSLTNEGSIYRNNIDELEDLLVRDLDGDDKPEIISISDYTRLAVYPNLGGSFADQQIVDLGWKGFELKEIVAEDFDGDGDADLLDVSGNKSGTSGQVRRFENLGSLNFTNPEIVTTLNFEITEAEVADVDMDGNTDLIIGSQQGEFLGWLQNLGTSFGSIQALDSAIGVVQGLEMADLDGDGDEEMIALSGDQLSYYQNLGGSFASRVVIPLTLSEAEFVHTADLDLDGDLDIIISYDDRVRWLKNEGGYSFSTPKFISNEGGRVATVDMDNDGDLDVWLASEKLYYAENKGGAFEPLYTLSSSSDPVEVAFIDLDGDETPDLISTQSDILYWRSNELCLMPSELQSTITGPNSVRLSWKANPLAFGYRINGGIDGGTIYTRTRGTNFANISGLTPGENFVWQVRSACPLDTSRFTTWRPFMIPLLRTEWLELSGGPNPSTSFYKLQASFTKETSFKIEIHDMMGRLVYSDAGSSQEVNLHLNVADWNAGMHVINVQADSFTESCTFVVR